MVSLWGSSIFDMGHTEAESFAPSREMDKAGRLA